MITENYGAVIWRGVKRTVLGDPLKPGDPAPEFRLTATNWSKVTLADSAGKVRLISVVPSLDTGICDAQTRRFNEEAVALGDEVVILTVSADTPYAQRRWCGAAGVDRVQTLSDHLDMNFGNSYATHMKEVRLERRAVFVVNADGIVTYVEYLPEIAQHPDYDRALAAVRQALKKG
jgi:thiol peroxidase